LKSQFHRLKKPALNPISDGYPVNDNINFVLLVLIEDDLLGQIDYGAVQLDFCKTLLPEVINLLSVLSFSSPYDGCKDRKFGASTCSQNCINYLRGMLAGYFFAATIAINMTDTSEKKPQIIINLCNSADCASRVLADRLLLDADGR